MGDRRPGVPSRSSRCRPSSSPVFSSSGTPSSRPSAERGVVTALRYALMLAIVATMVSGLFLGVGELVEDQQERAVATQLETAGNRLAADLGTASRLVETGSRGTTDPTVELRTRMPDTVAGSGYRVRVTGSGPRYTLVLRSFDPVVEARVVVRSSVGIEGQVSGGRVHIAYDDSESELVVRNG